MDPYAGQDFVAELQSQLASLRIHVEPQDLERENARLASLVSNCRCSGTWKEDAICHAPEAAGTSKRISSGHPVTLCSGPVKDEVEPVHPLLVENSSKCADQEFMYKPGCNSRTVCNVMKRYVALKIIYFGKRFYGFASEAQMDPTIESEIFKALTRTKLLIGEKVHSQYSRCGRTDKGVSSTGQTDKYMP